MKKIYTTLIMMSLIVSVFAQQRQFQGEGYMRANPKQLEQTLTAEQSKVIAAVRLEMRKEILQINNQLNEKRAQLTSLQQAEKPNLKAIDSKIDEITSLQNKRMKLMSQSQQKIREQLTPEQRLNFDSRRGGQFMNAKAGQRGRGVAMRPRNGMQVHGAMAPRNGGRGAANMVNRPRAGQVSITVAGEN